MLKHRCSCLISPDPTLGWVPLVMCTARLQAVGRAKPGPIRPGQAKVTAWPRLWPGLKFWKAKATGSGRSFHTIFFVNDRSNMNIMFNVYLTGWLVIVLCFIICHNCDAIDHHCDLLELTLRPIMHQHSGEWRHTFNFKSNFIFRCLSAVGNTNDECQDGTVAATAYII